MNLNILEIIIANVLVKSLVISGMWYDVTKKSSKIDYLIVQNLVGLNFSRP